MKKVTETIRVKIWNIVVTKPTATSRGDFTFSYELRRNKKLIKIDVHNETYTYGTAARMRKLLHRGYATELVLQRHF